DGDGHLPEVGVENFQARARLDEPFFFFETGHVELVLEADVAVGAEEVASISHLRSFRVPDRNRTGDDVHSVAKREIGHEVDELRSLVAEIEDLLTHRTSVVSQHEELGREVLRKDDHMAFIVGGRFDEPLDLFAKLLEIVDWTNKVLQRSDSDFL